MRGRERRGMDMDSKQRERGLGDYRLSIDYSDAPRFTDSYIESASWEDGTECTEEELDALNEDMDLVHELVTSEVY